MKNIWLKENLEEVVKKSKTQKECLEKMGLRSSGGNSKTLKKYIDLYDIETKHFIKSYDKMVSKNINNKKTLEEILVVDSTFSRNQLKNRLYDIGLLKRECCLCGQGENWNGMKISLIIDHKNGVYNDNRIENLRIVCPNCNAGLDTFAGKNNNVVKKTFYCDCGHIKTKISNKCNKCEKLNRRKVERPSLDQLKIDIDKLGYSGTGRKYGVSDNSIRKWLK